MEEHLYSAEQLASNLQCLDFVPISVGSNKIIPPLPHKLPGKRRLESASSTESFADLFGVTLMCLLGQLVIMLSFGEV